MSERRSKGLVLLHKISSVWEEGGDLALPKEFSDDDEEQNEKEHLVHAVPFKDFVVPARRHPDLMMHLRSGEVY